MNEDTILKDLRRKKALAEQHDLQHTLEKTQQKLEEIERELEELDNE